jgi:hypothetical protein
VIDHIAQTPERIERALYLASFCTGVHATKRE